MKKRTQHIAFVVGLLLVAVLLIVLPNVTAESINSLLLSLPGLDKVAHFFEHFLITLSVYYLLTKFFRKQTHSGKLATAMILSLLFSLVDEFMQANTAGRSFEIADIASNTLGTLTAATALSFTKIKPTVCWVCIGLLFTTNSLIVFETYARLKPYYRGIRLEKGGEFEKAMAQYQIALASGNSTGGLLNAMAWLNLAFLDRDTEQSLLYAEQAVTQDPHNGDYLDTYGLALLKNGKAEEALKYLEKAYAINPTIYTIHFHLAKTYEALGQKELALEHFSQQLNFTPDGPYGEQSEEYLKTWGTEAAQ